MSQEWTKDDQKWANEVLKCRQIVSEIARFGVNEAQKVKLIELLALELEDREVSVAVVNSLKNTNENRQEKIDHGRILT